MIKKIFCLFIFFVLSAHPKMDAAKNEFGFTPKEYKTLHALFSHLLLDESGVYTLFGDKPLSFTTFSKQESAEKTEIDHLHPILKNELEFHDNWKVWENHKDRFKISRYLLIKRKAPPFSTEDFGVFLVNIAATATALNDHYDKFLKVLGKDFDPIQVVFEIEDDQSFFWEKVLSNEDLLAILLGFGDRNGWWFTKLKKYEEQGGLKQSQKNFFASLDKQTPGSNSLSKYDLYFPLPCFGCFDEEQSHALIKKYEKQRKRIKKIYKGKDFLLTSLNRLTSKDLPKDPDAKYRSWVIGEMHLSELTHSFKPISYQ